MFSNGVCGSSFVEGSQLSNSIFCIVKVSRHFIWIVFLIVNHLEDEADLEFYLNNRVVRL